MKKASYNRTSTAQKQHTSKHIQLHTPVPNTQLKAYKSYYLKPLGRITIASLFVISAIILGCLYPQAAEGSIFLVIMALIVALNKDIRIDL